MSPGASRPRPNLPLLVGLALGLVVRALEFANNRSLGLDEARLAVNVVARSYAGLTLPLSLDQSAPILFLWAERAAIRLLGLSGYALRLLPFIAGTVGALLIYPLARRFLEPAPARLAALCAIFCPLLLTYTNAVKQYSTEAMVAIVLLLLACPSHTETPPASRRRHAALITLGVIAPWLSATALFVLASVGIGLFLDARSRGYTKLGLPAITTGLWGLSGSAAYFALYRSAGSSAYMHRFWEQAFLSPARAGFAGRAWHSAETFVWGAVMGDPILDRRPYASALTVLTALAIASVIAGTAHLIRSKGWQVGWCLVGPLAITLAASVVGVFPVAPRLMLFTLPLLFVLAIAGIDAGFGRLRGRWSRLGYAATTAVLLLGLEFLAVARALALPPSSEFPELVRQWRARRRPGEAIYVFARTLPAWILYSTDWSKPDTARVELLTRLASSGSPAFENAPSRDSVSAEQGRALVYSAGGMTELIGLASGMEWREGVGNVRANPDRGWAEAEAERVESVARPGVWIIASTWYSPETVLFRLLERRATRRPYAAIRHASALVYLEYARD